MNAPPQIVRRYDGAVVLTFPYAGDLVAALKARVPAYARAYDPDTRAWTIAAASRRTEPYHLFAAELKSRRES